MGLFRNSIVHLGSWTVFAGCAVWAWTEGGFEPYIGLAGAFVGIVSNFEKLPFLDRRRTLTAEQKIQKRDHWRPVFKTYFSDMARRDYRSDVIIHDVARLDQYPDSKENEKRISAWFRVGFMGTYLNGILLGLRWTYVKEEDGKWKEYGSRPPEDAIKVMLLAQVPYEAIESFNPDGDEYYALPHVFLHFDYNGEPYEKLFYGEERQLDPRFPRYYSEIAEYEMPSKWRRLLRLA